MRRTACHGVTLIELLIVAAIISVSSAALLAVVTAPGYEQNRATIDRELQAGMAMFFSRLPGEAHAATRVESAPGAFALAGAGRDGADVVYVVDAQNMLRRLETAPDETAAFLEGRAEAQRMRTAPLLVPSVQALSAEPAKDGLWRFRLEVLGSSNRQPLPYANQMDLGIGSFWTGGDQ